MTSVDIGPPGAVGATDVVRVGVDVGGTKVEAVALVDELRRRFGAPVALENDVNAAALGAFADRGAGGTSAYLNLGTGVAAGIVAHGMLLAGTSGVAGEIGHLSVDPAGPVCGCGQRGCIEALAGGAAIARAWGRGGEWPVRAVMDAAEAGGPCAAAIVRDLAGGVAAAVRVLVLAVDPEVVVIGGGVSRLGARLERVLLETLRLSASPSPFLRSLCLDERVELLQAGRPVGAIGAALVAEPAVG